MQMKLPLRILPQPDEVTCGPTCLHALYHYYNDTVDLEQLISEIPMLRSGGTIAAHLACHALRRGYRATIYVYNVQIFDPTWLTPNIPHLREKLLAQMAYKTDPRLQASSSAFLEYLDLGGRIKFEDLNAALFRKYLNRSIPILTGLSATYLYSSAREFGPNMDYDDIRGEPAGHFVILSGYHQPDRKITVDRKSVV